ncbi:hypothetical protein D3C78_1266470 [compost metagenome]
MLGYCAAKFPERHADIERAKETWESRNAYMINSEAQLTRAWLIDAGVQEEDIPGQIAVIEQVFDQYKDFNPAAKTIEALESQTSARRMQTCGLYTGLVVGGGQDVRVIEPKAQAFFEKYSSSL